jgi:hypothetical protein
MSTSEPATPFTNVANLVIMLLAPMFLWSTNGDIHLAYTAAAQTVNAYRVTNRLTLFTVAKIIAFDIATLSSLSQSMYEDVTTPLALRLRGNANSLDRSGERNRHRLEQASRPGAAVDEEPVEASIAKAEQMVREAKARVQAANAYAAEPPKAEPPPAAKPAPVPPSAAAPVARTAEQQHRAAWAKAMTDVAEEFTAGLKDLPPGERRKEMARIEAATMAAAELVSGTAPPPIHATDAYRPSWPGVK